MILAVDAPEQTVTISHRDIPRYMPAMSMPFHVRKAAELAGLFPGEQVEFELVARRSGSYIRRLRRIGGSAVIEDQGDRIVLPPNPDRVPIGSRMPDFALADQSGQPVRLSDFRGKVIAVDFIYTRCPLPDVCPRLSANFARLQNRFREKMGKDLMLLSITIDPHYDTPQVLLGYAKIWNARLDGWRFLTGPDGEIEIVARRFGMNYWPEEGLITHTSQTGVIARDGKLAAQVDGSSFTPSQLGDLIQRELEKANAP
jgi:protein SCO1/2